ncbi:hypothetical protein K440DRAFT_629354 [Wilcoxina mikolae CBS 423.85]|nr:hypothetical protein K440DRAFT_629354 [Wilcoxina mikolae CBS 423.85]
MPWVSIFASSTVSIGASKGLLDNFVLPAAPTGDETLYYEYAEDPDQRMRNRSLLFPTWNDPILLQRVQDSHMEVLKVV